MWSENRENKSEGGGSIDHYFIVLSRRTHCEKVSKYGFFSGPYFPVAGLYRFHSEYRNIWTRKNSVFGHFTRSHKFTFDIKTCTYQYKVASSKKTVGQEHSVAITIYFNVYFSILFKVELLCYCVMIF